MQGLDVQLEHSVILAPSQTRIVPLRVYQTAPFSGSEIRLKFTANASESTTTFAVKIPVQSQVQWQRDAYTPLRATYFFASSMPTAFLAIPPVQENTERILPPILALRAYHLELRLINILT